MDGQDYPNLMFAQGQLPDSPPDKQFEAEELDEEEEEKTTISNLKILMILILMKIGIKDYF